MYIPLYTRVCIICMYMHACKCMMHTYTYNDKHGTHHTYMRVCVCIPCLTLHPPTPVSEIPWLRLPRMTIRHTRAREDLSRGTRKRAWLTRAQLLKMYGNCADLVDNLIAKKISESNYRSHPDLPDVAEATLYHVT